MAGWPWLNDRARRATSILPTDGVFKPSSSGHQFAQSDLRLRLGHSRCRTSTSPHLSVRYSATKRR